MHALDAASLGVLERVAAELAGSDGPWTQSVARRAQAILADGRADFDDADYFVLGEMARVDLLDHISTVDRDSLNGILESWRSWQRTWSTTIPGLDRSDANLLAESARRVLANDSVHQPEVATLLARVPVILGEPLTADAYEQLGAAAHIMAAGTVSPWSAESEESWRLTAFIHRVDAWHGAQG